MNFSIDKIFYTVIFIIIIFIVFEYCTYLSLPISNKESFTNYKMCHYKKLNDATQNVLDTYNIKKYDNQNDHNQKTEDDWDIYIPCGYNYVEDELNNIKVVNPDQKIYAIDGCDNIASKNNLWKIIRNYYGREEACHLMPETYNITETNDINLFYDKYKNGGFNNQLFLLKKNIQRKKGILLTKDYNRIINEIKKKEYKLIQHYVNDLYLIKGRKLNLRLYVLIVCQNNTKNIYLYTKGKCIYTNKKYDENDYDSYENHLTSLNLDVNIYKTHPETFKDLKLYIGTKKYNVLFQNIIELLTRISIPIKENICQKSSLKKGLLFQLFGADVIFTKDLHPYLLEFNKGASMKYMTDKDEIMKKQLLEDVFLFTSIISKNNKKSSDVKEKFILL